MKNILGEICEKYQKIVIYGAGGVARIVCKLMKQSNIKSDICVGVTDSSKNPKVLEGYEVFDIDSLASNEYKENALFIVAIMFPTAERVQIQLSENGYQNVITADEIVQKMYQEFYQFPIQKGKVLFTSYTGKGYGCNPKYICEELLDRKLNFIECVWGVDDSEEKFRKEIRTVTYGTYEYYYELATAQIWVDNQHKDFFSRKRQGQYYIYTWHGCGPMKKIEYDATNLPKSYLQLSNHNMKMTDLCLAGSSFCTPQYRRAFRYEGEVLECGCPRNDIFFNKNFDKNKIRKNMGLPDTAHIILYAPTMREGASNCLEADSIVEACEKLFGDPCIILIREHPKMESKHGRYVFSDKVRGAYVSQYPDVQEIMAISDMLITDYSSVMWDFSLQRKPVFLFHPDADIYEQERGFNIPFSEMPYIEAFDTDDLYQKICGYNEKSYLSQLEQFLEKYKSFDIGQASKQVVDRILEVIDLQ